jgi:two-component system, chemotaxis family, CheB/CheR fusion protein
MEMPTRMARNKKDNLSPDGSGGPVADAHILEVESPAQAESDRGDDSEKSSRGLVIVGIGASAGGLGALKSFLDALPADTGMAFVLVPHLDPRHESMMVELLSQRTRMSICQAKQNTLVQPDHVYVIPPDKYIEIREGHLHLVTPGKPPAHRTAIDHFLKSLAEDQGELAVGIVLSGTGSHGTSGLKEIKLAGGMVMVQDPHSAQYEQMPQSAIDAGLADFVLSPQDMPGALIAYARHPYVNHVFEERRSNPLEPELGRILAILKTQTRYDFRWYRKKMMQRRVRRRMGLRQIAEPEAYLQFLREHPEEVTALHKDMLIGVTGFFREPEVFRFLEKEVLPELILRSDGKDPVRVWVPGCATGEEAYSLTMLLVERFLALGKTPLIQIFATDLDRESIARAREGVYPASIAEDVSPQRLIRFFVKLDRQYQIAREIRDAVVFAPQNLISDAPFSRLDLISCRNLMIYLELAVQQRLFPLFHFALKEGGYLVLGSSETVGRQNDLFEPVAKKLRIFRRIPSARRDAELPLLVGGPAPSPEPLPAPHTPLAETMRRILLDAFGPAAVLVNVGGEVLSFYGSTTEYLEFPSGEPSRDLISLLRSGLRSKARVCMQKALREQTRVEAHGHVRRGGAYVPCRIAAIPVREPKEVRGYLLITFQDELPGKPATPLRAPEDASLLTQLEDDLKTTREDLQITIEELESSNEELKAANEEMMSMNEELQSANEELETSKEELQSMNEELTTVNAQLQEKIEELDAAYTDLNNVLTSSDIATVFLDRNMRIRRFTPPTRKLMNVMPSDIGRPLADLSFRFEDSTIIEEAEEVLEHLSSSEKEISTQDGHAYIRRILPYRTRSNRIEGVTVTFMDITDRKEKETRLNAAFAGLEEQVSRRTAALTAIRDVAVQANAALTVEEIMDAALRRICDYNGWKSGYAYRLPEDGGDDILPVVVWNTRANREFDRLRNTLAGAPIKLGQGVAGRALVTGQPEWTEDLGRDLPSPVAEAAAPLGFRAAFAYPILTENRVVALLLFFADAAEEPATQVSDFIASVVNQVTLVIEREHLSRQLREMSAYEQVRLSQDLHDAIGQQLAGLIMSLDSLSRRLGAKESEEAPALEEATRMLRETLQQVRLLARGLGDIPVGPGALAAALEQLTANNPAALHSQLQCRAKVDRTVDVEDPDVAIQLYRIAQEALHNAISHSHGNELELLLRREKEDLVLEIRDDGIGLPRTPVLGMGLRIMQQRARLIGAKLEMRGDQGTHIVVRVPRGGGS